MNENASFFERFNNWIRSSIILKLLSVGFLILILLIPANMVESLIWERQSTRENAVMEVSSKWGLAQTISGPVLSVPYKQYSRDSENRLVETTEYAHFLPDSLRITGSIEPEMRSRGIYDVVVYNANLQLKGVFPRPSFTEWNIPNENIRWENAFVAIGISDMRGIRTNIMLDRNGEQVPFEPGIETNQVLGSGASARTPVDPTDSAATMAFTFDLDLNGSDMLYFTPVGRETVVDLRSEWADPSFDGAFLPEQREISAEGFSAKWRVLHLNRNYPQAWRAGSFDLHSSDMGVRLMVPVDQYHKSLRSAKYATMLISLTFLIFFFVEVLNRRRIHPVQYILVGLALCVFYALLVALSEHISFDLAYAIAAIAVIGLIIAYSVPMFKQRRLTLLLGGILVLLFGFIFTIIQLEDLALLMGSIGLFLVLAIVMYLSRKVDWYSIQSTNAETR